MYKKGDIVKCTISGFKEYGIFVKVDDNYDGLIHISEISESFVRNVTDYGEIGDTIFALVLEVDEDNNHLKLSIKNLNYKVDGKSMQERDNDGFLPLKNKLNGWITEKLQEIKK